MSDRRSRARSLALMPHAAIGRQPLPEGQARRPLPVPGPPRPRSAPDTHHTAAAHDMARTCETERPGTATGTAQRCCAVARTRRVLEGGGFILIDVHAPHCPVWSAR
ncbi:hypothetical protein [Kitasatospora sp. MBT63]|uniref:hypothetical protein n=1 Tax=Kitasatospora sp. MBT63 TaxID=1444768 RepID=UPI00053AB0BD|nr:hypothetical protein [Kitasatospora sp. MBT63]